MRPRRLMGTSLVVLVAVAASIVMPAAAAPPVKPPKGTASIAATGTACVYTVTYSWTGVSGAVNAYLRVLYQVPGQQFASTAQATNVAVSGRSGSVSVDLTVPPGTGSWAYYGRGSLDNSKNQQISNTQATSTTSVAGSC